MATHPLVQNHQFLAPLFASVLDVQISGVILVEIMGRECNPALEDFIFLPFHVIDYCYDVQNYRSECPCFCMLYFFVFLDKKY